MGYHSFNSISEYQVAIHQAIDNAMRKEITENACLAMQDAIEDFVYDAYDPQFNHRRMENGGLIAKTNISPTYVPATKTLTIEATAPWQNIGFRETTGAGIYGGDLSDVIENEQIYHAQPRPFAQHAEEQYGGKQFERDLQHALISRGL